MKKPRKNPWHKRRVNSRYRELCDRIDQNPEVVDKAVIAMKFSEELQDSASHILKLHDDYNKIMDRQIHGDVFQSFPIENLEDLYYVERDGYAHKPTFKDLLKANDIKKQGQGIIEQKFSLATDAKVSQIDLILAQINVLLEESEK